MLATRMIAICDRSGCKAKTKATIKLRIGPATKGLLEPITLQPVDIILPDEWSWGWDGKQAKTVIGCDRHPVKR